MRHVAISELVTQKLDYGVGASAVPYVGYGPRYIRITDIADDGSLREEVVAPSFHELGHLLAPGDIVLARTGASVGKSYLYRYEDGELAFAGFLVRARVDSSKSMPYYAYAHLHTARYWNWVEVMSVRSGQPGINAEEFGSFKIPLPPLPTQRRIAAVLQTWDRAIALAERQLADLRDRKRGLMQRLLTGETRLPGFEGAWEEVRLGEVVWFDRSQLPSSTPPSYKFNYVSLSDVEAGHIIGHTAMQYDASPSRARRLAQVGDVIYSTVRPHLKGHAQHDGVIRDAVFSTGFVVIQAKPKKMLPSFLWQIVRSSSFEQAVVRRCTGSNYPAVTSTDMASIKVSLPSLPEQQAIIAMLNDSDQANRELQLQVVELASQKKGLMQRLLEGDVDLDERFDKFTSVPK